MTAKKLLKKEEETFEESVDDIPKFMRVWKGLGNKRGVKAILSNNNSGVIFVWGSPKEFDVVVSEIQ